MKWSLPSLSRRISLAFFFGNAVIMALFLLAMFPAFLFEEDEPVAPELAVLAAQKDLTRMADGRISIGSGVTAADVARRHPGVWFVARSAGRNLTFGNVPEGVNDRLSNIPTDVRVARFANLGGSTATGEVMITRAETNAGSAVIAGGGIDAADLTFEDYLFYMSGNQFWWVPIMTTLLALGGAILVKPLVAGSLRPSVDAAASIDPRNVKTRLPEEGVVQELLPLVKAFNTALDRLAAGFEQRRRFIADVAHELRTPIAILDMQIAELPQTEARANLQRTVFRLTHLVGQMLDAERLSLLGRRREQVNLVELAKEAVADAAPLALSHGYDVRFSCEVDAVLMWLDPHAITRALANLLGNAVAHGGSAGIIQVSVSASGTVEVSDQGPGIPLEAHERIFEPFHRERWDRDGCGLGLYLVREIVRAHDGEVRVLGSTRGARFQLSLPSYGKSAFVSD